MNIPTALLLFAMAFVESNCDPDAVSLNGRDVGILQISPIMVEDCNRIVGEERWSLEDRYDIAQSYEMAGTFWDHYCRGYSAEDKARCWNQGHTGWLRNPRASDHYWHKIKTRIKTIVHRRTK